MNNDVPSGSTVKSNTAPAKLFFAPQCKLTEKVSVGPPAVESCCPSPPGLTMPTTVIALDPAAPDPAALGRAADVLRRGGLVAFPTETVYGLGANALDAAAVGRIFAAKGRPANNPVIVHVAETRDALPLVTAWPESAARLAAHFWPGPLTLVLPRSRLLPDVVTA